MESFGKPRARVVQRMLRQHAACCSQTQQTLHMATLYLKYAVICHSVLRSGCCQYCITDAQARPCGARVSFSVTRVPVRNAFAPLHLSDVARRSFGWQWRFATASAALPRATLIEWLQMRVMEPGPAAQVLKLPPEFLARHRAATVTRPALPAPGDAPGIGDEAGAASFLAEPEGAPAGMLALAPPAPGLPAPANPSGSQCGAPAAERWIVGQDVVAEGARASTTVVEPLPAQPPQPGAAAQPGAAKGTQGPAEGDPEQGAAAAAEQPAAAAERLPEGLTRQPRQALAPGTSLLSGMVTVRPLMALDM